MRLAQNGLTQIRKRHRRCRRVAALRGGPRRTTPPPVWTVRHGKNYEVLDGFGDTIGTIPSPEKTPRLGCNEETVYLWRDN